MASDVVSNKDTAHQILREARVRTDDWYGEGLLAGIRTCDQSKG